MNDNNISIKTISDLLKYNFYIPSYQRGYRWTKQQVENLLNDINEFSPKEIDNSVEKTWYCLQPIVVKQKDEKEWNGWEVIDGQQRLTTIYLILHRLNKSNVEKFDLRCETRENSAEYLKNELNGKTIDNTNVDYHFISSAYQTICDWFEGKGQEFEKTFESKFKCSTKVIWYKTSENEDSIDIFTRINSGKIPLTNAELIKALFLNSSNYAEWGFRQQEIASEWDRIEYALQDDSFWYFINKSENNLATRIEFIFNLMSDRQSDDEYATFDFFNKKFKTKSENEMDNNWQDIKEYFQTLEEWFNDRELYHKIGYLIATGTGTTIKDIRNGKEGKSKTAFADWINKKIQSKFERVNFEKLEYKEKYVVREILLLHNIQTMLNNKDESSRFPFDRYKKGLWDVEHIHAIATTEVKVKKEEQADWLKNNFVPTDKYTDEKINQQIQQIKDFNSAIPEEEFTEIIAYVLGEEDNSIRNLCLLDSGTNRSYKNDGFKEKRRKIIEREMKGTFIPICTKNVFMKYYSDEANDLELWNDSDRNSYSDKMQKVITEYLP